MLGFLNRLLAILSRRERRALVLLALAIVLMALLEVVAISSIAPFVGLAARPDLADSSELLSSIRDRLGLEEPRELLLWVGFGVLGLLVLSNTASATTNWLGLRFAWGVNASLSHRLLLGYLSRDYLFFVRKNSADLSRNILSEVAQVTNGILIAGFNFCARSAVAALIVTLLFVANPKVAAIIVLTLGCCYAAIFFSLRFRLLRSSAERVKYGSARYRMIGAVFSGIKDVKCFGKERFFLDRFEDVCQRYGRSQADSAVIGRIPSYALELLGFGAVILMMIGFIWEGQAVEEFLPVASLYVFAGYRLLPALQQGYAGLVSLRYNKSALDLIFDDLRRLREEGISSPELEPTSATCFAEGDRVLPFTKGLEFRDVHFAYPEADRQALDGINLCIKPRTTVGIAGPTGAGKTTLVDLMLGLVEPDSGEVAVDDTAIDEDTARDWRRNIGYVPQAIFLYDDTIRRNIAFGEPDELIDDERVREVARIAHIAEHIESLPDGYETEVGERGIRLSGGQRQRIGIARAVYHDPEFIILDEATSALDNVTEAIVMEMIGALGGKKTIVIIAHRISTIRRCDRICVFDQGRIAAQGPYDELIEESTLFRELATAGEGAGA